MSRYLINVWVPTPFEMEFSCTIWRFHDSWFIFIPAFNSLLYTVFPLQGTPDASLYNAAIQGMCLRGKSNLAKELYARMRRISLKPDGKTRALMLQIFTERPVPLRKRWFSYPREVLKTVCSPAWVMANLFFSHFSLQVILLWPTLMEVRTIYGGQWTPVLCESVTRIHGMNHVWEKINRFVFISLLTWTNFQISCDQKITGRDDKIGDHWTQLILELSVRCFNDPVLASCGIILVLN